VGSVQSESIDGFEGPDWVEVGHGDDLVDGGKGDDVLIGGAGHDVLMGDLGNDRLVGQDGDDILAGGQGADLLIGGAGHDILMGDSGNDRLFGQDGNDVLNGGDGDDALHGDGDNDTLIGLGGADTLYGGDGDDNLSGNAANDIVYGGDGNDVLNGGDGNDVLNGGTGGDIIDGGAGIDQASYKFSSAGVAINPALGVTGAADLAGNVAFVTAVFNNLFGRDPNGLDTNGGADNYWVAELEAGADIGQINLEIMGGALGDDLAFLEKNAPGVTINLELGTASGGEAEGDNLISIENIGGSIHADILTGDANENRLLGNGGNDTLSGGAGIDQLIGGSGDDILEGGADADQFVFGTTWGNDIVSDFEDGADLLDLSRTSLAFTDLTIIQVGDHAMVADGDGNSIRLDDIDFNNISETDFIW
jgi:Ca2+-binding RTX toxin-like protein